ncbi:MAG: hypothetical protein IPN54_05725 [Bacteroidetes bacterium]|nr:hypothetical protein [Bacteroidota bacterium]
MIPQQIPGHKKANYGGGDRAGIATFTINGKGYLATGRQSTAGFVDLWQYDPQTNLWTQKSDFPGTPRWDANCFTIGNSGYLIGGYSFHQVMWVMYMSTTVFLIAGHKKLVFAKWKMRCSNIFNLR